MDPGLSSTSVEVVMESHQDVEHSIDPNKAMESRFIEEKFSSSDDESGDEGGDAELECPVMKLTREEKIVLRSLWHPKSHMKMLKKNKYRKIVLIVVCMHAGS